MYSFQRRNEVICVYHRDGSLRAATRSELKQLPYPDDDIDVASKSKRCAADSSKIGKGRVTSITQ